MTLGPLVLEIRADSGAVEVIANLTGCKGTIRIEAKELREGACHTETGDYLITTLPEERYKVTWLDSAAIYDGTCLVGPRWAISRRGVGG